MHVDNGALPHPPLTVAQRCALSLIRAIRSPSRRCSLVPAGSCRPVRLTRSKRWNDSASSRLVAGHAAPGTMPSTRRTRLRPRPRLPARLIVHGKTRSSRGRSVVHCPVRLPGDVSPAEAAAARGKRPGPGRRSSSRPSQPTPSLEKPSATAPAAAPAPQPAAAAALVADANDREIVVESDAVRAVFSTKGGVLTSWRLKRYAGSDGQPLDLVPQQAVAGSARRSR